MPIPTHWISVNHGDVMLRWPPLALLLVILLLCYLFALIFMRELNEDRRDTLRNLFRNNLIHAAIASGLFALFSVLAQPFVPLGELRELVGLLGILTLIQWTYFTVKLGRLFIFILMFVSNLHVAFPLLFVNIGTLIWAVALSSILATELFSVQVMPILATSAVASLVLGIALQDTLGNLFAGVALQMDKPYEIDHWVEVQSGGTKWVGKVHEISWRATLLVGFSDESITIPNRIMAQSTILNYSVEGKPFLRGQTIRLPYGCNVDAAKRTLIEVTRTIDGVHSELDCFCFVSELSESFVTIRLLYYITDFPNQMSIGDRVQNAALSALYKLGITPAAPRIDVITVNR